MAFEFWHSLKTSSLTLHAVRSDKKMMRAASAVAIQLLVMLTSSIQGVNSGILGLMHIYSFGSLCLVNMNKDR